MSRALVVNPHRAGSQDEARPRTARAGDPRPAGRIGRLIVVVGAVALAVAGMVGIRQITADREAAEGRASIGAVSVQLRAAEWVNTDHDMTAQPGFQMPSAMMPGMPTGDDVRLSISTTFTNTAGESVRFNPVDELVLRSGNDVSRGLMADTFGEMHRIVADSAVNGLLYFDVPAPQPGDPPFYLEWRRDSRMVRLPVIIGGTAPEGHGH